MAGKKPSDEARGEELGESDAGEMAGESDAGEVAGAAMGEVAGKAAAGDAEGEMTSRGAVLGGKLARGDQAGRDGDGAPGDEPRSRGL